MSSSPSQQSVSAIAALSDVNSGDPSLRDRVFDGEHVALTKYRMRDGIWVQVTLKDATLQRSGHGYILLNSTAVVELAAALLDVGKRLPFPNHSTLQE